MEPESLKNFENTEVKTACVTNRAFLLNHLHLYFAQYIQFVSEHILMLKSTFA